MGWIIAIVVIVLLLSGIFYIRDRLFSSFWWLGQLGKLFGNRSLELTDDNTPKSVSSMTAICRPQILKDFPDFVWEDYREKCSMNLICTLNALSSSDTSLLYEMAGSELKNQIEHILKNEPVGKHRFYSEIIVHQTEIIKYEKKANLCIIRTRSAVGFKTHTEKAPTEIQIQTRYDQTLNYELPSDGVSGNGIGLKCPNCGAPITSLGLKKCEYCGAGMVEIDERVWKFGTVNEVIR